MFTVVGGVGVVVMIRKMQVRAIVAAMALVAIMAVTMGVSCHSVSNYTEQK